MANANGTPGTLVAAHPRNENRLAHGLYSRRELELSEDARELVDWLMTMPHVTEADRLAAEHLARLDLIVSRIDVALGDGRVENRRGEVRTLLDHRRRYATELGAWLDRFGLTPKGRADWARSLASGGVMDEFRRRLSELEEPL